VPPQRLPRDKQSYHKPIDKKKIFCKFRAMQTKYAFIFLIFLTFPSFEAPAKATIDRVELEKKLSKYKGLSELKVPFTQTKIVKGSTIKVTVRGNLHVVFPDLVKWNIVQPGRSEVLISKDSIKVSTYDREGKLQSESYNLKDPKLAEATNAITALSAWLKLDVDAISKDYDFFQEEPSLIHFVPKAGRNLPFTDLRMKTKPNGALQGLAMVESSGDSLEFEFQEPEMKYLSGKVSPKGAAPLKDQKKTVK
jgi:outer membrane lipoprotein-sorting protein